MTNGGSVCVVGSFGFGNVGDEAIPLAIEDIARSLGRDLNIATLTRYSKPADIAVIGLGPEDSARRRGIDAVPVIVSGGGIFEPRKNAVHTRCFAEMHKQGRGLFLYGCSAEPGRYSWMEKHRIRRTAKKAEKIYVRDAWSGRVLSAIAPNASIEVIGDLVMSMLPDMNGVPDSVSKLGKFISVTLAPEWTSEDWFNWISEELGHLATVRDATLVFLPFAVEYDSDVAIHSIVAKRIAARFPTVKLLQIVDALPPRAIMGVISQASATIGMRLHACVMAKACGVPLVGLAYHPKLMGFAETMNLSQQFFPFGTFTEHSTKREYWNFSHDAFPRHQLCAKLDQASQLQSDAGVESFRNRHRQVFAEILSSMDPAL